MRTLLAGLFVIVSIVSAHSADVVPDGPGAAERADWSFKIQAYMWGAGLSGKTKPLPNFPVIETDLRFKDILEQLKFAGMTSASAHYGRFGVSGDLQYVVTRDSTDRLAPLYGRARVTTKSFIGTLLGDYKVITNDRLDLIASAGARLYSVDIETELTPDLLRGRRASGGDTWVDPFFGLRANVAITPKIFTNGWAYVGGFGVGSDFSADLYGGLGYRFTDHISATAGYRWLRVDRDIGSFIYDVTQQGVMAGVLVEF
ncbi:MAG: hypothetical protein ROR55_27065 [Devosia sp.]